MKPQQDDMQRILYRSIAAISCAAWLLCPLEARRPNYGGTLRIETAGAMQSPGPEEPKLAGLVFETLVRLDDHGRPQPWLALSWSHDAAHKRWIFTPRPNVTFHNGMRWEPDEASLEFSDDRPIDRILADLARPRNAIVLRTADGTIAGTGPFAVTHWEPGKSATLTANAAYWGGRPYLDSIEIGMGQPPRQQALDFDLGKADAIEVDIANLRRLRQQNANLAVSPPMEVLALIFDGAIAVPQSQQQAVALSIDRAAIHNVLLQRQGEVSAALLPQWLSGYSFVFSAARDLARARAQAASSPAISISYERGDALARAVAERIAVNVSEAGIPAQAKSDALFAARVVRLRIAGRDARTALEDLAEQLKAQAPSPADNLYNAERALLGGGRVIPLVHLPLVWRLSSKVHGWDANRQLADTWIEP